MGNYMEESITFENGNEAINSSWQNSTNISKYEANGGNSLQRHNFSSASSSSESDKFRKRCNSQPQSFSAIKRPRRPQRSMVTMEGMVYDPQIKEFSTRPSATNERRSLQMNQLRRLQNDTFNVSLQSIPFKEQNFNTRLMDQLNKNERMSLPGNLRPGTNLINMSKLSSSDTRLRADMNRLRNRQPKMSAYSMRSINPTEETLPSSTKEEKRNLWMGNLTQILSFMYAVFIFTIGSIIYIIDVFIESPLSVVFSIYLICAGFAYLIFLLFDIRKYTTKKRKYHKKKNEFFESMQNEESIDSFKDETGEVVEKTHPEEPTHHYCFSGGRHAGSFYLKIGAAIFCLGLLIHSSLFLNIEIIYLTSDLPFCGDLNNVILNCLFPIYGFFQLFFLFKYSNVIILRYRELARFALMHCLGSSLCFWVRFIVKETVESLRIYNKYNKDKLPLEKTFAGLELRQPVFDHFNAFDDKNCSTAHGFDFVIENVFPYMYPFSIEFSILIVGIYYIIWSNIGNCTKEIDQNLPHFDIENMDSITYRSEDCKAPTAIDENGMVSNLTINIDCHSSNKGWFGGIIMVVACVVSVIMTYVAVSNKEQFNFGVLMKDCSELVINLVMLIAVVIAYYQITKLDVNQHPIDKLDDLLLLLCIPAYFMDASFTVVPAVLNEKSDQSTYTEYFKIVNAVIVVVQVLVQTPFIIDALRRCSNSRKLRLLKPGRELVAFLLVCNVSSWIFETFSVKNDLDDQRYDFYGKLLWTILGHISTPLSMFYRFHSSVCLADIWKCAYVPGNKH